MSTYTETATVAVDRAGAATTPAGASSQQHSSSEIIELQPGTHYQRQQKQTSEQDAASPDRAAETPQDAASAKVPYAKLIGCGFSFFFSGVNDGTLGPLIPYIQTTFSIGTGEIAIIYATSFLGWFLAALLNPFLTGQSQYATLGRILAVGAALQLAAQVLRSIPVPQLSLPLYAVSFFVQTLGMALQDAHGNTFVSSANLAHRWLGFIHASYAAGTLLGPPIATAIASRGAAAAVATADQTTGDDWTRVYFVLLGIGVLNLVAVVFGFSDTIWKRQGVVTPVADGGNAEEESGTARTIQSKSALQDMQGLFSLRSFWMLSLFYFFELGAWMTAAGWVVEYLVKVRSGELSKMGYVPTGWNGGILLGRILLAEPTFRLGERRMILIYSAICTALQLVFWLVPNIIANATALSIMGFFFGPFFATGVSVGSKLLPRKVRSQGLSLIFVVAQAGASLFPSLTGIIATREGVQVLQPIVLALIVAGGTCWWLIPKGPTESTRAYVPHFPEEDSKLRATSVQVRRGGNGANTLEVLQQLLPRCGDQQGQTCPSLHLMTPLPDAESPETAQVVDSFGTDSPVDLSLCLHRKGIQKAASSYIVRSNATGSRTIVNHNPLSEMEVDEFLRAAETWFSKMQAEPSRTWWHFECIRHLRRHWPSVRAKGYRSPEKFLRREAPRTASHVFVTWGGHGASAMVINGQDEYHHCAVRDVHVDHGNDDIRVVDTVGAGDTFIAGILFGFACHPDDWDLPRKLRFAVRLATQKVQMDGFGGLTAPGNDDLSS
ncbi:hypothetical protein PpBr36_01577 [Pyricularia pennisetigena]|uniref:hypothetical protein n=1 Tax=Pyricularia pennisetigena TaxID=1578925 RepID=UPI00114E43D7|nr:hypothetical protein PpBr36_01577 [Pyricularia pennisetigena]TLS28413.1 hypothetical protein PpBr36_01577 [Pyricularia pennisetigena]